MAKSQASQKASYDAMITNRHAADKVCEMVVTLEGKYKNALGRYEEVCPHTLKTYFTIQALLLSIV